MRKLTILFILLFSTVMFSSPSYAEWTKVGTSVDGDALYVDFERIRKHGGYVYWWRLSDYLKPNSLGDLSVKVYQQGDCKLFRYKSLSYSWHKEPMGGGTGLIDNRPDKEWGYPPPKSTSEFLLKSVCSR